MTGVSGAVEQFIEHALSGRLEAAREMLVVDPALTSRDIFAAAAYGDAEAIQQHLDNAAESGGPRNWPPLLFLCYSGFQRFDAGRQDQFMASARILLKAGADPNAQFLANGDPDHPQSALYGACGYGNNPALTRLLLDAGADPNEGASVLGSEALYHAAELPDLECLALMLAAKPDPDKVSYCLARKLDFEDIEGTRLFLAHGADPNFVSPFGDRMTRVHHAIQRGRGSDTIALLLDHGGDISMKTEAGHTPYALAVRYGRPGTAILLRGRGAREDELSPMDRFIGACALGDQETAKSLRRKLTIDIGADEYQVFTSLAGEDNAIAVRTMLQMGFDPDETFGIGPALHHAAWTGAAETVAVLLAHGPNLESINAFGGTPLDITMFGAGHCHDRHGGMIASGRPQDVRHGDYPQVVKTLLDAGANADATNEYPCGVPEIDRLLKKHQS